MALSLTRTHMWRLVDYFNALPPDPPFVPIPDSELANLPPLPLGGPDPGAAKKASIDALVLDMKAWEEAGRPKQWTSVHP